MSADGSVSSTCATCGRSFDPMALGDLCPICVMESAMGGPATKVIGDYELLQVLGEGGMATVYIAKHREQENLVALKIPKRAVVEHAGLALARREIQTASALVHPNIVRTYTSGTHDGLPFLVMQLLDGGTLEDPENRVHHARPEAASELMIKIARAVECAHQRAVLHCDLKPANILMDTDGEPYVSDFGLAHRLGRVPRGGTDGWMSPEQAAGKAVFTASDVYPLGRMLRWLLEGDPAAGRGRGSVADRWDAVRRLFRGWWPTLKWDLEAIADKATEYEADDRYRSAAEFADDLVRAREVRPIIPEASYWLRRAIKWIRRHWIVAALAVELPVVMMSISLLPLSLLVEMRNTYRAGNASHVREQAGAVMNELRSFAEKVEAIAANPDIRVLVTHENLNDVPPALVAPGSGLDLVFVLDEAGTIRARWPAPGDYKYRTHDFSFRDYYHCQNELAALHDRLGARSPRVCVSRAFHNSTDSYAHLAFSAPLFDDAGRHVGAVVGTTRGRATFGAVQMNCSAEGDCSTALLGLLDRDESGKPLPTAIHVLAEPGLHEGDTATLTESLSSEICTRFGCERDLLHQFEPRKDPALAVERYDDPVTHQPSFAALAPVGGTGLVVVVATPNATVDILIQRLITRMKYALLLPATAGGIPVLGVMFLRLARAFARAAT